MKNERQIEIKIDGNICTFNYINESETSNSRVSGQMSLSGSLANFDDLTLTVSKVDDYTPSNKNSIKINEININKKIDKKLENTNEKSKLEITYMSIFNSEQKNENSSIKKTPFNQDIIKKINENDKSGNKYENDLKDSVIKKLNFDLCDSSPSLEKSEKNYEQNNQNIKEKISKDLNKRYFIHEKNIKNNIKLNKENDNKTCLQDDKKYININKSTKTFKNRCHSFQREKRKINRISLDSNDGIKRTNNKISLDNINNNNLNKNNSNSKISIQKLSHIKKKMISNNYSNVQEIMNSEKYKERKEKLHKYFDKLSESKNNIKANYIKLTSEKFKKHPEINDNLSKIVDNIEKTEEKVKNPINEEILKTSKKLFPQLSSTNSFNVSNSKNKLALGLLSSNKKNYYQTPSSSNIKLENITTSTKNGSSISNMNTPIISNTFDSKINSISKTDNKDIILKLYYGNSTSKKLFKNNKFHDSTNKKLSSNKNDLLIDRDKDSIKYLLKKHNTDLKNVMKINNKKIQTILIGKNCFGKKNVKNNLNNNRINEINEFKQFIQKNQFDKDMLKTIKKRGSFH